MFQPKNAVRSARQEANLDHVLNLVFPPVFVELVSFS